MSRTAIVVFGASGDLAQRKLGPALYSLFQKGRMPEEFDIVGFARRPSSDEEFRARVEEGVRKFASVSFDSAAFASFVQRIRYVQGDMGTPGDAERLAAELSAIAGSDANHLYYLATPPEYYQTVVAAIGRAGMAEESEGWRRIVIEKPFGSDEHSAASLNAAVHEVFSERQVYRIDHYLGKDTAQNILYLRFANTIFEPIWNRSYVESIQITVGETVDVGHRAGYYDGVGVLRDMFQNHILQLLCLTAMEPPNSFEADAVRDEKVKVLEAIRPVAAAAADANAVYAQYVGYLDAPGVTMASTTPTYAAVRLFIDNWRWQGVPVYLRSGKALAQKQSDVVVTFRRPPHLMFRLPAGEQLTPNTLLIRIQPDEGIAMSFEAKVPDFSDAIKTVRFAFDYKTSFGDTPLGDAYERLLLDAMDGDAALFARSDEIEWAWRIFDPIIAAGASAPLASYAPGTWGPAEADALLAEHGHAWSAVADR